MLHENNFIFEVSILYLPLVFPFFLLSFFQYSRTAHMPVPFKQPGFELVEVFLYKLSCTASLREELGMHSK